MNSFSLLRCCYVDLTTMVRANRSSTTPLPAEQQGLFDSALCIKHLARRPNHHMIRVLSAQTFRGSQRVSFANGTCEYANESLSNVQTTSSFGPTKIVVRTSRLFQRHSLIADTVHVSSAFVSHNLNTSHHRMRHKEQTLKWVFYHWPMQRTLASEEDLW